MKKTEKPTKGVNVVRKMNLKLPGSCLETIYKSFVRTHLDSGDVIYDQRNCCVQPLCQTKLKLPNVTLHQQ